MIVFSKKSWARCLLGVLLLTPTLSQAGWFTTLNKNFKICCSWYRKNNWAVKNAVITLAVIALAVKAYSVMDTIQKTSENKVEPAIAKIAVTLSARAEKLIARAEGDYGAFKQELIRTNTKLSDAIGALKYAGSTISTTVKGLDKPIKDTVKMVHQASGVRTQVSDASQTFKQVLRKSHKYYHPNNFATSSIH